MDDVYRTEKNVDVRERLLVVGRVLVDNEQAARVAEKEFYRSRWWAYKWLKRFAESGLEGLKNPLLHGYTFIAFNRVKTARKTKFLSENNGSVEVNEI